MTIKKEILSIIKTLKEFWMILLGQHINVFTDHKKLMCTNFIPTAYIAGNYSLKNLGLQYTTSQGAKMKQLMP